MKAHFIFTYEIRGQEFLNLEIQPEHLKSEQSLFDKITEDFQEDEKNDLFKISCCVNAEVENLPEWYLQSNGKMWIENGTVHNY